MLDFMDSWILEVLERGMELRFTEWDAKFSKNYEQLSKLLINHKLISYSRNIVVNVIHYKVTYLAVCVFSIPQFLGVWSSYLKNKY